MGKDREERQRRKDRKRDAAPGSGRTPEAERAPVVVARPAEPLAGEATARGEPLAVAARNEVLLVGRVPALPEERELPSGDLLVSWRLVVDRPAPVRPRTGGGRAPTVDTVDCVAWDEDVQRQAHDLTPGDVVQVRGSLRRRFWRAGAAAASRYEVEAAQLERLTASAPAAPT